MKNLPEFFHGVEIFIVNVVQGNRDMYISFMNYAQPGGKKDGYRRCVEAFHRVCGGLDDQEVEDLEQDILPQSAIDVFGNLEQLYFNDKLVTHRVGSNG